MSRWVLAGAVALLVGFVGGAHLHHVVAQPDRPGPLVRAIDPGAHRDDPVLEDCPRPAATPPYPVNENGMTYGSGTRVDEDAPEPDLVAARGSHGRCGFVRAADRRQGLPGDPEEAARATTGQDPAGWVIPLYARDGVTVIGTVQIGQVGQVGQIGQIGQGEVLTSTAPQPPRSTP